MLAIAILEQSPVLEPDWGSVGLLLAIVGSFLLGNAVLFRRPRQLVRERFAASAADTSGLRSQPLLGIRGQIFHRLQVLTGFLYLVAGFALQLLGRFRPPAVDGPTFPVFWIAVIALATVGLVALGWWWSANAFRRYVRAHLAKYPLDFEADMALSREIGELFGVESHPEDTVESYVARLRQELRLPALERRAPRVFHGHIDED